MDMYPDEESVESFVQRNVPYYQAKWQLLANSTRPFAGFNWAAWLGGPIWLLYRKLYLSALLVVVLLIADVTLWLYAEERGLITPLQADIWAWAVAILLLFVFGFLGNYWYWRKFRLAEQRAARQTGDRNAQLAYLRSQGGTNRIAAVSVLAIFLLPVGWGGYWAYQGFSAGVVLDATGPLTLGEIQANYLNFMSEPLEGNRKDCVHGEITARASAAGDPEQLNPESIELLQADNWDRLDALDKRFDLSAAIVTKALLECRDAG